MEEVEIQPERAFVKRWRMSLGISQKELDLAAGTTVAACVEFEHTRALQPLTKREHKKLVAFLSALLEIRPRDYPKEMKLFREQHRLSLQDASEMAGVSKSAWFDMENGFHKRFPHPKVRLRVDVVLARFEQTDAPVASVA